MYQKFIAAGYLGKDPESRVTNTGKNVANFSMAVGRDKQTEWLNCVAWEKTAELVSQYLTKGSPVLIEGRLQTRKWQDKEGNDRYTTEVVVDRLTFLPNKDRDDEQQPARGKTRKESEAARDDNDGGFNDDIPF